MKERILRKNRERKPRKSQEKLQVVPGTRVVGESER